MLEAIETSDDPLRYRDMALFAKYAYTGLRRNDALSLKIQDVDLVRRFVLVHQKKTGASDIRILPTPLVKVLEAYLSWRSDHEVASESAWLFPGREASRALAARQAQDCFHHSRRTAGLSDGLSIHSFRLRDAPVQDIQGSYPRRHMSGP